MRKFSGKATVVSCTTVEGQANIFLLRISYRIEEDSLLPKPGQFYLLKSLPSTVQLARPISVYDTHKKDGFAFIDFLILQKGIGTQELCSAQSGTAVQAIGPLGNCFADFFVEGKKCIVGAGIGVAPVSYFARTMQDSSYDFYASFKTKSYGLENLKPKELCITTEDGSQGVQGMLPAALTSKVLLEKKYSAVFACGPAPMLSYIKDIAKEADIPAYLSMETKMACGVGACLGCAIKTSLGVKEVCKDGPVFLAEEITFEKKVSVAKNQPEKKEPLKGEPSLSVDIAGVHFQNPVIAASGTFGFGRNYEDFFDVNALGGICAKGCTLEPREGNGGVRLHEVAAGNINSIGLQNPGLEAFIREELPAMLRLKPVAIANLAGSSLDSYVQGARLLEKSPVPMIELNISCPNVKSGGQAWGISVDAAATVVRAVKEVTSKPLMVKLTPNAPDIVSVSLSCIDAGADALSLINTISSVAIDIENAKPVFNNVTAGLCGPCVKPIALRMVYDVARAIRTLPTQKQVPIVGIGGIATWQDAVEFIMAGAYAVQVGTATFSNPQAMVQIIEGLSAFMKKKGYASLEEMRGLALG